MAKNPTSGSETSSSLGRVLSGLRVAYIPSRTSFDAAAEAARGTWLLSIIGFSFGAASALWVAASLIAMQLDPGAALSNAFVLGVLLVAWAGAVQAIARTVAPANIDLFEPLVFLSSTAFLAVLIAALGASLLPAPWSGLSGLLLLYLCLLAVLAIRAIGHVSLAKATLVALAAAMLAIVASFMVFSIIAGHQSLVEYGYLLWPY